MELSFCIETVGGSRVLYSRSLHFKNIIKKNVKRKKLFLSNVKTKVFNFLEIMNCITDVSVL